ncbi:Hypothetical protein PACV_84 [Pacmanvirus A23]|uniref:Hypothetical protein n=1 Tax=Pacmanvirus A23 TaxID=1932881 RepID=UPI000A0940C4|nr:Hypothetical protein B9W72_gp084 [Pacmanvirus A23]SIP85801.1 Hypothetical protein PACV_84 [Pacmanvirus A23]
MNFGRNIAILQSLLSTPVMGMIYAVCIFIYGPDIILGIINLWININFWLVNNEYIYGVNYCMVNTLDISICTVENMVWAWCKLEIIILLAIIIITPILIIIGIFCTMVVKNTIKQINTDIAKYDAQALS